MEFGICFKGFVEPDRAKALVRQAENAGFTYCWFYDSHILWRESYIAMAMCIEHTTKMRFGPCVTNPNTRDWSLAASMFGSLAKQSKGRFDIGLGRGDSAVRVMGLKPATLAKLRVC
jgi:alkanesulfonate monooxygenase SsuD/methylene tetrahydromethanopterin reductase-like flavin-dependent oxidoreductase (luciferase family)